MVTYREGNQPQRIYAFVWGTNGHLFVNWWDGSHWAWADQGIPPGTAVQGDPGESRTGREPNHSEYMLS